MAMQKISGILKYIPGYRSRIKWKMIVASIYYLLTLFTLSGGLRLFLFYLASPFFVFNVIKLFQQRGLIGEAKKNKGPERIALNITLCTMIVSFLIAAISLLTYPGSSNTNVETVSSISVDAEQTVIDELSPTPVISPTPAPTNTPKPTATPIPTSTPIPTDTAIPTPTPYKWEEHYKPPVYTEYTTPASENELDGTLLQINGTVQDVYADTETPYFVLSTAEGDWLVSSYEASDVLPVKDENVTVYGMYLGTSNEMDNLPALFMNRINKSDGVFETVISGVHFGDYYEGRTFEDIHSELNPTPTSAPTFAPTPEPEPEPIQTYVGNKNTKKFHYEWCSSAKQIKASNRVELSSRAAAINAGYVPCKNCNP